MEYEKPNNDFLSFLNVFKKNDKIKLPDTNYR
jgi:hypothetical protein